MSGEARQVAAHEGAHGDHASHAAMAQSTGHASVPHARFSESAGQALPPCAGVAVRSSSEGSSAERS